MQSEIRISGQIRTDPQEESKYHEGKADLVGSDGDVGALDDDIALEGIVGGEVWYVAACDGSLVGAQVEVVAEAKQEVGGGRHHRRLEVLLLAETEIRDRGKQKARFAIRSSFGLFAVNGKNIAREDRPS